MASSHEQSGINPELSPSALHTEARRLSLLLTAALVDAAPFREGVIAQYWNGGFYNFQDHTVPFEAKGESWEVSVLPNWQLTEKDTAITSIETTLERTENGKQIHETYRVESSLDDLPSKDDIVQYGRVEDGKVVEKDEKTQTAVDKVDAMISKLNGHF